MSVKVWLPSILVGCILGGVLVTALILPFHLGSISMTTIEGKVVLIKYETWPFNCTRITFETLSGSSRTYSYEDHLDIRIGETYRITSQGSFWHALPKAIEVERIVKIP